MGRGPQLNQGNRKYPANSAKLVILRRKLETDPGPRVGRFYPDPPTRCAVPQGRLSYLVADAVDVGGQ